MRTKIRWSGTETIVIPDPEVSPVEAKQSEVSPETPLDDGKLSRVKRNEHSQTIKRKFGIVAREVDNVLYQDE